MSPLRDLIIEPLPSDRPPVSPRRNRRARRAPAEHGRVAPSLGVLAPARELPVVAFAAALTIARGWSASLVCVDVAAAPSPRAPARSGASRLAASLTARGIVAEARGPLAVARLPDDPAELGATASRALAAAGGLPTVLAVSHRSARVDALLTQCDAILVALPPAAEPSLAALALSGATELAASAAAISPTLDPLQRALALAGCRPPAVIRHAIEALVA